MITDIEIEGFKSFEKVRLKLGGFNLFIGANASGKSNFFDALRVLQGIGYGFTIQEVFDGKPKGAGSEAWEGIRGGLPRAVFARRGDLAERAHVHFSLRIANDIWTDLTYSIELSLRKGRVFAETLRNGEEVIFDSSQLFRTQRGVRLDPQTKSGLGEYAASLGVDLRVGAVHDCLDTLSNMQRVEPSPSVLRQYSQAHEAKRLGERGENFAGLVRAVLKDERAKSNYLSWLRQLTPMELDDVAILEGALGEPLFALREGETVLPAPILSDGTLRFAAITAAFFQPDMPAIITIEEIENGIHPSRVRLLLELLKSQSGNSGPQVFATTHSPVVLAWLEEKDYETTFLCRKDEETGASIVTPLSEIPRLIELVRKQPIGELFTEGWLEDAF